MISKATSYERVTWKDQRKRRRRRRAALSLPKLFVMALIITLTRSFVICTACIFFFYFVFVCVRSNCYLSRFHWRWMLVRSFDGFQLISPMFLIVLICRIDTIEFLIFHRLKECHWIYNWSSKNDQLIECYHNSKISHTQNIVLNNWTSFSKMIFLRIFSLFLQVSLIWYHLHILISLYFILFYSVLFFFFSKRFSKD